MYIGETIIKNSKSVTILGMALDHRMTFREYTAKAIAKVQNRIPLIQHLAFAREASILTLHYMTTTSLISILLRGSKIWLTGARCVIGGPSPT